MEVFIVGAIAATLRIATPLIFGTLGELFCERSGILNLGIEGTMFLGCFVGFVVGDKTGNLWLGVLMALISGMVSGLLMALLTVKLGVNQHVSGLGITLLLTGFSLFIFVLVYGDATLNPTITPFQKVAPFGDIRFIGPVFDQYMLTYIAFALIPVVWWLLFRTNFGLHMRAVGENPEAADAAGIDVYRTRTIALVIGGALMAVAGSFISLAQSGTFIYGIIAGRGWVCIALIIFGNWHPVKVMWGSLLFGAVYALQLRLQATGMDLPYEVFLALPYIVTIIALVIAGRNVTGPSAILKPYTRE
jgi:general nucleoside transport system permease protein